MAPPSRPSLSITLPPNFQYTYASEGQFPRTPEHQLDEPTQTPLNPPPPPRPQTFKVRRKRAPIPTDFQIHQDSDEPGSDNTVIPTIEMSEAAPNTSSPTMQTPVMEGLLAPGLPCQRLFTPPKTPAPRAQGFSSPLESPANEWALINEGRNKLRPAFDRSGSICSSFSDSSVSSYGSSAFSAPNNGSCTSPESEVTDPFLDDDLAKDDKAVLSPDQDDSPIAKRIKTHRHIKWTQAMEEHLWMTYMQYLSDPRVTPFKMLPGTPPPLGVCSRVASKARRTWSSRRASAGIDGLLASDRMQREGSPDTIRPTSNLKQPQWPRSDSATRKRLRDLCKRKPSLPAHYQRLIRTRSPSPFTSSSSVEPTPDASAAFSSHDMKMSLVTATAPSMQPDGPLAQLSGDDAAAESSRASRTSRPEGWFARIPRSQAHQKSLSLQSGLSLTLESDSGVLASPFDVTSNRTHLLQSMSQTKSLGRTSLKEGPSLDSPVELSGAPTMPRTSLKRRFKSDEEKPKRPGLEDVFGPQSDDAGIVRNRGFSVGAVRASDHLTKLFTPPVPAVPTVAVTTPGDDYIMGDAPAFSPLADTSSFGPPGSRSVPRRLAEPIPRLGSPFTEISTRQSNTFPRRYHATPGSGSQPFQQRLRELAAQGAANQQQ